MTKIEAARDCFVRVSGGSKFDKADIDELVACYEDAYTELEFDRNQCKLLLTKMMEYVNAEEQKDKKRIIRV